MKTRKRTKRKSGAIKQIVDAFYSGMPPEEVTKLAERLFDLNSTRDRGKDLKNKS